MKTSIREWLRKKSGNNEILRAVSALFGMSMMASVVGMVGALVQGRFVSAEELGFFKQFSIVTGYAFFLHFGIFEAIGRLYPIYMGQGKAERAKEVVEIGNSWILIVCTPLTLAFAALTVRSFLHGDWKTALCWIVQIVAIWTSLYGGFLSATYRSGKEFEKMAKANVLNPILSLLAIPLYWVQPFIAMVIRNCCSAVSTIQLHRTRPVKVNWRFSIRDWGRLIRQGMPLFIAFYITYPGLDAIRGTLILKFLTQKDLGYWSFAYTCMVLILQLPGSISAVYAPIIMMEYAKNGRVSDALVICKKSIRYGAAIMVVFAAIGVVAIRYLLPVVLPNYTGASALFYVLMLSLPLKLSDILSSVLTAMNKTVLLNTIAIICAAVQVTVAIAGSNWGLGIVSFGLGFLFGYFVRTIAFVLCIAWFIKAENPEVQTYG